MKLQKRLASQLLNCGINRVRIDTTTPEDVKSAITKEDIRKLIQQGTIYKLQSKGISRVRAKQRHAQQKKGRRKGSGSKKGTFKASVNVKREWMRRIRTQRTLLKALKSKGHIDTKFFRELYRKAKGGFFRSRRHVLVYAKEKGILKQK